MTILLPRARRLSAPQRGRLFRALNQIEAGAWNADWGEWAHPGQHEPPGDWRT